MTQTNLFTHKIAAMQFLSRLLKSASSFSPHTKVMTIKKALALTSTVSLSVLIAQSANAATLGARASVNLIEMDHQTNGSPASGSLVEASASEQGSSGTGFASFDGKVGASAMSENTNVAIRNPRVNQRRFHWLWGEGVIRAYILSDTRERSHPYSLLLLLAYGQTPDISPTNLKPSPDNAPSVSPTNKPSIS